MTRQGEEQMYEAQRLREEAAKEVAKDKGKGKLKDEDAKAYRDQYLEDENEDGEEKPPTKRKKTS